MIIKIIWRILLIIPVFLLACNISNKNEYVKLNLNFKINEVSDTNLRSSFLYPILEFKNLKDDSIFVYYEKPPVVLIYSSSLTIELRYYIEELPEDITYYEYPYPLFLGISSNSNLKLFDEIEFYQYIEKLQSGTWDVIATVGYLDNYKDFSGYYSHKLRDQIVMHQNILKSDKTKLSIHHKG